MNNEIITHNKEGKGRNFWIPIIGCSLIHWSLGFSNTLGNAIPYIASYMFTVGNENISLGKLSWVEGLFILFQGGSNYLYPAVVEIIGYSYYLLTGIIFCAAGLFVSYLFLEKYLFFLLGYSILYAIGHGMLYASTMEYLLNSYPRNTQTKIVGLLWLVRGTSMSSFSSIQFLLVNPKDLNFNIKLRNNKLFGSLYILDNIPRMIILTLVFSSISQIIGVSILLLKRENLSNKYSTKYNYGVNSKDILNSESMKLLWLISFLSWPCIEYVQIYWKIHGIINTDLGDFQLTRISSIALIIQTIFRGFWGIFGDIAGHFNSLCVISTTLVTGILLLLFPVMKSVSIIQFIGGYFLVSIAHSGSSVVYPSIIARISKNPRFKEFFIFIFSAKVLSCLLFCTLTEIATLYLNIHYSLVPLLVFSLGSFFLSFILRDVGDKIK
ncbi:putative monocarboxylate transporter [Cryptosporidium felis]|nr:putative monocarboxylate transporter [Cryptosporidium felis]